MARVNIHIDTGSLSYRKVHKALGETSPVPNSEIDNKNRADITIGPVVKKCPRA
jgi:hypothetical protein